MPSRRKTFSLSAEEISVLRQVLGQVAPSPDGRVMKLRDKLYLPLDGTDVDLSSSEVRFMRDLLKCLIPEAAESSDHWRRRLVLKLTKALKSGRKGAR